ncbi:MAG TPA: NADH-quinone oxidoreductase subunit M [Nocardioidaceae bacterium]|nr:NADH-quinone oxidoreductase subunit M [Nocardioidaceae bacterium]
MNAVLLNGLVAVPAGFALLAALLVRRERAAVGLAVLGSFATLAWSVWLVAEMYGGVLGEPGSTVDMMWLEALDVHWRLGVDGISGPLILMSTIVFATALFSLLRHAPEAAEGGPRRTGSLAVLLMFIEAGVLGSFLALDMVLFFVFFEVALIPMWFVINAWGDAHDAASRRKAATRFLVFTVTGSALMLVGFLLVRAEAGTFDIVAIASSYTPSTATALAASLLVGLGLAVKTPLWPLHIWLPDAHSKAPTVGSVLLAAVLLKLGTYGFLRFWMPVTSPEWLLVPVVAALAVVGIVYAALACLAQTDLKRLIAYSSVGHMGFVVLGAATFTIGGVQAAVFASVAHGLITGLLFFLAGAIKDRYGTADLAQLRVLYGRVPRLGGLFAFAAMASLGLPGLAGFWGEMLAIRSAVDQAAALPEVTYRWLAFIAALGVILTSAYFLAVMRGMLQGPTAGAAGAPDTAPVSPMADLPSTGSTVTVLATDRVEAEQVLRDRPDVGGIEWLTWSPLIVLTVVLGVAPGLLLSPVAAAASTFLGGLR